MGASRFEVRRVKAVEQQIDALLHLKSVLEEGRGRLPDEAKAHLLAARRAVVTSNQLLEGLREPVEPTASAA